MNICHWPMPIYYLFAVDSFFNCLLPYIAIITLNCQILLHVNYVVLLLSPKKTMALQKFYCNFTIYIVCLSRNSIVLYSGIIKSEKMTNDFKNSCLIQVVKNEKMRAK